VKQKKVLERLYNPGRLRAAGIDRMTVEAFERREDELLKLIHEKLKAGTYRFKPARRVLILKEESSKKRKLGIPVVMDRVVGQSINLVFAEIFDPGFIESNFGFRKGKSQHRAIKHVQAIVVEGYEWCASIDLKSFFDEIPHGLILKLIRRKIVDEGLVTLIARTSKEDWRRQSRDVPKAPHSHRCSPTSCLMNWIMSLREEATGTADGRMIS